MISAGKIKTKKIQKKEKIITAAAELFSKKNYHEVMMDDVAKQISVAKGTLYNYFNSKEDLYFTIMISNMERLITYLREKGNARLSTISVFRAYIIHLYSFLMNNQNFFLMYQKESLLGEHKLRSKLRFLERELKDLFQETINTGKSEGIFREVESEFATDLIIGSVYGSVNRGIENQINNEKFYLERERVYDFLLHSIIKGSDNNILLPLLNKTIVITRTVEQSKESSDVFLKLGANVIIFPTLDILPPGTWEEFDKIILNNEKIDFLIFTSSHAVRMFIKRCNELNIKPDWNETKVVAVGNKTADACRNNDISVDIIPAKFSGEGVITELSKFNLHGKIIFIPRSEIGREELPEGLKKLGAQIKTAPVYNVSTPTRERISEYIYRFKNSKPNLFIFTSPSTFENFMKILKIENPAAYFNGYDLAAIGPTTKTAIEQKGVNVSVMPEEYTINSLADAIVKYYER
jgi:uroporphyrinogen-III synthase/AcrR family transcriptional regulator